jgi:ribosome-associated toxin RatA of RatAB toxin-antitoxin module
MKEVRKTVLVGHTAEQMFSLVDAVERYPEFLPWCAGTAVSFRDADRTRATIRIDYRGMRQSFTTDNRKQVPICMEMHLVEGPFRTLEGKWRFTDLAQRGCKIEFELRYEFSSTVLEKLVGPIFNYIATSMVEAFVRRAEDIYAQS